MTNNEPLNPAPAAESGEAQLARLNDLLGQIAASLNGLHQRVKILEETAQASLKLHNMTETVMRRHEARLDQILPETEPMAGNIQ